MWRCGWCVILVPIESLARDAQVTHLPGWPWLNAGFSCARPCCHRDLDNRGELLAGCTVSRQDRHAARERAVKSGEGLGVCVRRHIAPVDAALDACCHRG